MAVVLLVLIGMLAVLIALAIFDVPVRP